MACLKFEKFPFQRVDFADNRDVWVIQHLLFQILENVAVFFQCRKVSVHCGIEQCVNEVVHTGLANATAAMANALSNRVETVAMAFLEGNHEIFAEEHGELLCAMFAHHRCQAGDDQDVALVLVHLRTLMGIDHVF